MLRTFNMGLGMLLVVPSGKFKKAQTCWSGPGKSFHGWADREGRTESDVHVRQIPRFFRGRSAYVFLTWQMQPPHQVAGRFA